MTTVTMKAASTMLAGSTVYFRDGSTATVDASGFLQVPLGSQADMLNAGCTPVGVRNNDNATTNPGATNDSTQDYVVGSKWYNKSTGGLFICVDATASAAVWNPMTRGMLPVALTDAATITPDASLSDVFTVTLGGNRTLANPSNLAPGQMLMITVSQDGTGNRTLAYGNIWTFDGGTPTLSTSASAVDLIRGHYDGVKIRAHLYKAFA
jgi:hypothetical protein